MEFNNLENWGNWFITLKNRHNSAGFGCETLTGEEDYFTKERQHWKIYLTVNLNNGQVVQTSNIVEYNEDEKEVKTFRGSIYKLGGTPINESQKKIMKNYFTKDEYPAFDARL